MITHTYPALAECARRRLSEWDLSRRELRVLELVLELSFEMEHMWACIPRLQMLADACGLDKADASRTLRRLIHKGALMLQRHKDETLYTVAVTCETVPMRQVKDPVICPDRAEAAREALRGIQERRQDGEADPSGQIRLPRILEERAEDHAAPEMALQVMLDEPTPAPTPSPDTETTDRKVDPAEALFDPVFTAKLEADARKAMAESGVAEAAPLPFEGDELVESCRRGLEARQLEIFDAVQREFARGGPRAIADFRANAKNWRKRILADPYAVHEAVSDHRLRCKGAAQMPGKWMWWVFSRKTKPEVLASLAAKKETG